MYSFGLKLRLNGVVEGCFTPYFSRPESVEHK